jgi:hypothetical protein
MDLKVGEVRKVIASTIGEDLAAQGFVIDKSLTWIKKKVNKKNKIEFFINCYNYAPVKVEFKLIISFWIWEVNKEMEAYYKHLNEPFDIKNETFIFADGEFNPALKDLELKFRKSYTYVVTDMDKIEIPIEECREVLQEEIIPLLPCLSELPHFQDYVLENYKNSDKLWLARNGLIAMKLKGLDELKMLADYYWKSQDMEKMPNDNFFRRFVENIVSYAELDNVSNQG